jgi:hypothetical protein
MNLLFFFPPSLIASSAMLLNPPCKIFADAKIN